MVLKQASKGAMTLAIGGLGFVAGMIGWAGLSGVIGAILDMVGVVIPAETYLMASPFAGLVVAGYAVQEVSG